MIYRLLHFILRNLLIMFFRMRISGQDNIPATGGVIIATNHISYWDPPLVGCGLPSNRKVHFMAKAELFAIPGFGWTIARLGAFPVRRGMADRNAVRTAIDILNAGEVVGIFPEGTRSKNGVLGNPLPGMPLIAIKAGVPIIPAAVTGTNEVLRHGLFLPRFTITYGKPLYPLAEKSDKENIEDLNTRVMREIAALLMREVR